MHKLIRKGQFGLNTGNVGAVELPKVSSSILGIGTPDSMESIKERIAGMKIPGIESLGTGTGKSLLNNLGGTSGLVSLGSNIVNSLLPERIQSNTYKNVQGVLNLAKNIPGVGGIAATALSTALELTDFLGLSKVAKLNNNLDVQDILAHTEGGYGDFMADWEKASLYAGKNVGFWTGASKYNNMVYDANRLMSVLQGIIGNKRTLDTLTALMGDRWNERTMMNMNGGPGNISFGRLGLKIEILDKVHTILNTPKVMDTLTELEDEVPEFKEGGKMNVIPEGSLHARLHHMENAEGLTKKGIPVVSEMKGGELEQQAEIELNEIIFTLEVTQELEKLMQDGSDDAAIEAGKLLVKEIFENTDDRTGLLKLLEPEKKEQTPEKIVAQHQVFLQGGTVEKPIEQLVDYAIQVNPLFVQRIGPNMGYAEFDDEEGQRRKGTHLLGYTEKDGKYLVFPQIQMKEGRLQYIPDWKEAFNTALKQNNVISFDNEKDALNFTEKYKDSKQWKHHFDIWKQRYD